MEILCANGLERSNSRLCLQVERRLSYPQGSAGRVHEKSGNDAR